MICLICPDRTDIVIWCSHIIFHCTIASLSNRVSIPTVAGKWELLVYHSRETKELFVFFYALLWYKKTMLFLFLLQIREPLWYTIDVSVPSDGLRLINIAFQPTWVAWGKEQSLAYLTDCLLIAAKIVTLFCTISVLVMFFPCTMIFSMFALLIVIWLRIHLKFQIRCLKRSDNFYTYKHTHTHHTSAYILHSFPYKSQKILFSSFYLFNAMPNHFIPFYSYFYSLC